MTISKKAVAAAFLLGALSGVAQPSGYVVEWGSNLEGEAVGVETPGGILATDVVRVGGSPVRDAVAARFGRLRPKNIGGVIRSSDQY